MQCPFKHYYEYTDFCSKINRLIKAIYRKQYEFYKLNPTHRLEGIAVIRKRELYKNMGVRLMKVRESWVDRHNKEF